jgi:hypothetical protein
MKHLTATVPEVAIVGATRALAGVGIGLLLANHLLAEERRKLGWTLFAAGAFSTIPILFRLLPRLR